MFHYHNHGDLPTEGNDYYWVFGSNLAGIHGKGAALVAKDLFNAEIGVGVGITGKCYAIPTKDNEIKTLPLDVIKGYVNSFKQFANSNPDKKFWITGVGTGLAGYTKDQIAPLFKGCGRNCSFPKDWQKYIEVKLYAGIGSRETPEDVLEIMKRIAEVLAQKGLTLRSGAAPGADQAFEVGCDKVKGKKEIWLPWEGFNEHPSHHVPTLKHLEYASKIHPVWDRLSQGVRKLHARNVGQVFGYNLNTPVEFVVCYTSDGAETASEVTSKTGGTGTAIKIASQNNIPVFNLGKKDVLDRINDFIKQY